MTNKVTAFTPADATDKTVSVTSSNPEVVKIDDANGVYTLSYLKAGEATVTYKSGSVVKEQKFTITDPAATTTPETPSSTEGE